MNGCEFCGKQDAEYWKDIGGVSRLFCSEPHSIQFGNIMNALKFHAGWSTVDMLITQEKGKIWNCKAFRGMVEIEFTVCFDDKLNIENFIPQFEED
ncbi:MAG: TA0938 family protein [Candidatus Kariarchaeaceae archaeon]|jgi:hypothetical protein